VQVLCAGSRQGKEGLHEANRLGKDRVDALQASNAAERAGKAACVAAAFGLECAADGSCKIPQGVLKLLATAEKAAWADSADGWQAAAKAAAAVVQAHGKP
jgi:hypothetical protein